MKSFRMVAQGVQRLIETTYLTRKVLSSSAVVWLSILHDLTLILYQLTLEANPLRHSMYFTTQP